MGCGGGRIGGGNAIEADGGSATGGGASDAEGAMEGKRGSNEGGVTGPIDHIPPRIVTLQVLNS